MKPTSFFGLCVLVAMATSLIVGSDSLAQKRSRTNSNGRSASSRKHVQTPAANTQNNQRKTVSRKRVDPDMFRHACYKFGAGFEQTQQPLNFVVGDYQWNQPNGPNSQFTLTYSYSNLLDGDIQGLTSQQLKQATEEAFSLWASVTPIDFVEVDDVGPNPSAAEASYSAGDSAQIRIGTHAIDGVSGNQLAHAFLPYSDSDGIAGDLHIDIDEDWGASNGGFFLEMLLHELGHTLGLDHEDDVDAIMNSFIGGRFSEIGEGFLLADDIDGIQSIYGSGTGSVSPLDDVMDEPDDGETDAEANDVVAELDTETGTVTLQGDSSDNSLLVYSSRWFTVVLGNGETTVNGNRGVFWMNGADNALEVVTSSGDDTVILFGVVADSVTGDLGEGDDSMAIVFSRIESLDLNGGEGDDLIFRFFNRIAEFVESGFETIR